MCKQSHKKQKESLETWVILFVFLTELKISGVPYRQCINLAKNVNIFFVEMTLRLQFSVVMIIVQTLVKLLEKLLQVKKIVAAYHQ